MTRIQCTDSSCHKKHWKYADRQRSGLSVNLRSCMHSEACSIALHPGGEEYFHVAALDLKAIERLRLLSSPLVAQYSPGEESHNRCHFEIVPLDGTVLKWMELGFVGRPVSTGKMPSTNERQEQSGGGVRAVSVIFGQFHCWVRRKDGTLVL